MRLFGVLIWLLGAPSLVTAAAIDLTGTVLMPDGRPAVGTRVELLSIAGSVPVASSETDAAGRFALQAPSSGLWRVVVRSSPPLQSPPLPVVEPLELPPARAGAWAPLQADSPQAPPAEPLVLSGQVVDESSRKPIPGALVWASADPGAFVRTDAEGRFQVAAPGRRRFDLEVLAPGYLLERALITRPQLVSRKAGTFALARAGKLRGKVMDSRGRPLAGAAVHAVSQGALGQRAFSPSDPVADRAMSDLQGRFELRRLRPGQSHEIRAFRAGSFPVAELAAPGRDVTLVLLPARSARGKVQDPAGKPITGAEAAVRPALRPGSSDDGADSGTAAQSDARGVFSLPELPAAEVELTVRRKGYAPAVFPALRIPSGTGPADLGVVTLRPGATLTGRVVDQRGQPVPGGEVFLLERPADPNEIDRALEDRKPAVTVAADGRFAIEDLAQGSPVHVAVRSPGYLIAQVRSVRPPTEKPVVIRVEPEAVLAGRVVDEAGAPVPGARIDFHWQEFLPEEPDRPVGRPILKNTRANGEGRFELRGLPAGTARVSAAALTFVPLEGIEVELPRPATAGELRLVLERGALLQGRVTTAAGEPVPGVRVGVSGAGASTNDDGLYWLEGAELGRQEVIFLHPSHGRVAKPFEIQPGVNVLDLAFEPGVEVAGRVVDGTGKPVPGAKVELTPEYRFDPRQYRDVTGEDGRFLLSQVVAGRYLLKAGADGFADTRHPGTLSVLGDPVSNLEITLDKGAQLSGNILGAPAEDLAQVEVEARGDNGETVAAWTDGRGRYEVRSLAPGDWTVTARLWDDQRQARARVAIRRSDREVTRDLEFEKRLALTVQVLYDDEPLPDARVSVRGQRITAERTAMTDYEGRVRFDDLAPETYLVGLRHERNMIVHNDQVDVQQDRDFVIRLQGATIGGLVTSAADGEPIPDAMLSLRPVEGPEYLITAGTKSDGRFAVYRVQPNRYRLQAGAQGFLLAEQELQVAAGQTLDDLEVRLQPAQGARVRVRLASGEIPAQVHVQVRDKLAQTYTPRGAEGIVELSTLPPGTWTVLVGADGGAVATASLVVPSEEPVAVTLPPAGELNVRVPALIASDLIGTVRLAGQDGQPFWTLGPGGNVVQQWPLAGGKAVVKGVPPGTWIVQAETPDGQRWQGAAVTGGAPAATVTIE